MILKILFSIKLVYYSSIIRKKTCERMYLACPLHSEILFTRLRFTPDIASLITFSLNKLKRELNEKKNSFAFAILTKPPLKKHFINLIFILSLTSKNIF